MTIPIKILILTTFLICTIGNVHGGGTFGILEVFLILDLVSIIETRDYEPLAAVIITVMAQMVGLVGIFNRNVTGSRFAMISTLMLLAVAIPLFIMQVVDTPLVAILTFSPFLACSAIGLRMHLNLGVIGTER